VCPASSLLFVAYLKKIIILFIFALPPDTQVSLNSAFHEDWREADTESRRTDHDQLSIILDILGTPSIDDFYAITSQRSREYIRALPFRKKKNFQTLFPNASPLVSFKVLGIIIGLGAAMFGSLDILEYSFGLSFCFFSFVQYFEGNSY
jgi:hypothetical protein